MNAPDKIFIYRESPKDYFEDKWGEGEPKDMECIAYISKDTLLEWAGLMRNDYDNSENADGWNACLDALINHIESL